jgi:hypothetical protein
VSKSTSRRVPEVARDLGLAESKGREKAVRSGEVRRITLDGRTYVRKWKRCNDPSCTKCPHGPYWHVCYRQAGREQQRYVGKDLTAHLLARRLEALMRSTHDPDMFGFRRVDLDAQAARPWWVPEEVWRLIVDAMLVAAGPGVVPEGVDGPMEETAEVEIVDPGGS